MIAVQSAQNVVCTGHPALPCGRQGGVTGGIDLQWGKAELLDCGTYSTGSKEI